MKFKKDGLVWIAFNEKNGHKQYLNFSNLPYLKSSTPHLVDLKITNYCTYGCKFCYQNSTLKGEHSSLEVIFDCLEELARLQVLEIAIGGGEPTAHPFLPLVLKKATELGISPHITTRHYKLFQNPSFEDLFKSSQMAAVAFSVSSLSDLTAIIENLSESIIGCSKHRFYLHLVPYTFDLQELESILTLGQEYGFHFTFLGYKENGRGERYLNNTLSNCSEVAIYNELNRLKNSISGPIISIDTLFASKIKDIVISDQAKYLKYEEGKFSMYIDLVDKKCGPSSYHPLQSFKDIKEIELLYKEY